MHAACVLERVSITYAYGPDIGQKAKSNHSRISLLWQREESVRGMITFRTEEVTSCSQ
jgi:hypothetical protein